MAAYNANATTTDVLGKLVWDCIAPQLANETPKPKEDGDTLIGNGIPGTKLAVKYDEAKRAFRFTVTYNEQGEARIGGAEDEAAETITFLHRSGEGIFGMRATGTERPRPEQPAEDLFARKTVF